MKANEYAIFQRIMSTARTKVVAHGRKPPLRGPARHRRLCEPGPRIRRHPWPRPLPLRIRSHQGALPTRTSASSSPTRSSARSPASASSPASTHPAGPSGPAFVYRICQEGAGLFPAVTCDSTDTRRSVTVLRRGELPSSRSREVCRSRSRLLPGRPGAVVLALR